MNSQRTARVVVDRIEGDLVVLVLYDDDQVRFNLPAQCLPEGVAEGDHLRMSFAPDESSREAERTRVQDLLKELKGS